LHPNLVPKTFNVLSIVSSHSQAAFTSVIIFKWASCSGCTVTKKNGDCFCSFLLPTIPVFRLLLLPKLQQEKDFLTMFLLSKELCPPQHKVCRFPPELLGQALEVALCVSKIFPWGFHQLYQAQAWSSAIRLEE